MAMGTRMKTAMSAWMFFKGVLMIAITVVGLLCGLAVFRRVRVVWVVVEVVYVGRGPGQIRAAASVELIGSPYVCMGGCTALPVIALPLKYELMCETTF